MNRRVLFLLLAIFITMLVFNDSFRADFLQGLTELVLGLAQVAVCVWFVYLLFQLFRR